jgi:hypothetical protein
MEFDQLPDHLVAEDPVPQQEVSGHILHQLHRSSRESDEYDRRPVKSVTLAHLKRLSQKGLQGKVVEYMRRYKTQIDLTESDSYSHHDPCLAWRAGKAHKLDYICVVGNKLGLHAALTNGNVDIGYQFTLFPKPNKPFSGKYAQLGFDQTSSLLYIGSRPGEEVFVSMAPIETLALDFNSPPPIGSCKGSTTVLKENHSRILINYIVFCLSKVPQECVYLTSPYGVPLLPEKMSWDFTNAL